MTLLDEAKSLLAQNDLSQAEVLLWRHLRGGGAASHEAWLHLGEVFAARGQLRRALGAWRRAMELDLKGQSAFLLHEATSTLSQLLHRDRRPFLHPRDEMARNLQLVEGRPFVAERAEELLEAARALEPLMPAQSREALTTARRFLVTGLTEAFSEQSPALELEQRGGEAAQAYALRLRALHLAWYDALLAREEPLPVQ